ncbi:MAG: RlmE family RNA methyltransferase [bacterium]|nr:RlmE family RNA methyltransferase [bacterium]MBU1918635.1 RlmE family RNA methyltransferase [bacterium]
MANKSFDRKDRFYHKAKKEGYPARSAYKIVELSQKYNIFKKGNTVIDLGAAPGGWFKVGLDSLKGNGKLIGIDLLPLNLATPQNAFFLQADFTENTTQDWLKEQCPQGAHWVISDLSPNITGIKFKDTCASYELATMALNFARSVLKLRGGFLCKVFPGGELEALKKDIKSSFKQVKIVIPEATRKSSTEIYIIGTDYIN